jgi:hypothetical protein
MKTRLYKKLFLLLLVLALLLVSLPACAASKTFTQEETDTWVAKCIADYGALHQKDALHFSRIWKKTVEGREAVVLADAQIWFQGDDYLKENVNAKGVRIHNVTKNDTGYKMQALEGQSEVWVPEKNPYDGFDRYHTQWEERGYQFESIWGKGEETKVTFLWDLGYKNCTFSEQTYRLTFCYQGEELARIVLVFTTYNGTKIDPKNIYSVKNEEYVFHTTPESEIAEKIDAAFKKASGK